MERQTDPTGNNAMKKSKKKIINKIKQKYICLIKLPNILVWKQTFYRGYKKSGNKTKE